MKSEAWLEYAATSSFPSVEAAGVTLYPESHEVFVAGKNVRCSRTHFRFLFVLVSDFCRTVPYERIMATDGRQLNANEQNLLKVQMFHLRRLLRRHGAQLEIRNVYGQGYQAQPSRL